jgi:hypothetical protein
MYKKVDEYYCSYEAEKDYLISKGFKQQFQKIIMDSKPTMVWKFIKSEELYLAVAEFYKELLHNN